MLTGRCYEGDGAPAYWPWLQVLRDAEAASDDDALRSETSGIASELAELTPELEERIGSLPEARGPRGEQARFRLFDAVAQYLSRRSARTPLLVILDDLHWADASSLGLMRFLATQLARERVLVCASYRDVEVRRGHPLAEVLPRLRVAGGDLERPLVGGDGFPEKVTAFRSGMAVHGRYGQACPACGTAVQRIRYAENETNYCPTCQTNGKLLADRSLSRLLKSDWPKTVEGFDE